MSKHLKLHVGSTANAYTSRLEDAKRRIKLYASGIGQVRRRLYRQFVLAVVRIVQTGNNSEIALDSAIQPAFAVYHLGILTDCHSIDNRNRVHSHERAVICCIQHRTINIRCIWIRTVENNHGNIRFGASLHNIVQSRNVSVETHSNILQVKNHNIDILQLLGGRLLVVSVQ